jgi:hypothetical protein
MLVHARIPGSSKVIALAELPARECQQPIAERCARKNEACGAVQGYMEALRVPVRPHPSMLNAIEPAQEWHIARSMPIRPPRYPELRMARGLPRLEEWVAEALCSNLSGWPS